MGPNEFITHLKESFNPEKYNYLKTITTRKAFEYFFLLILFSTLLFGLAGVVRLHRLSGFIDESFTKIEKLNVSFDVDMKEPVTISKIPLIVLDLREEEPDPNNECMLITKSSLYRKRFRPDFKDMTLFETVKYPLEGYSDLAANKDMFKTFFGLVFIILLPSILLVLYFYNMMKYFVVIMFVTLIGYAISRLNRMKMKKRVVMKVAIFTSTLLVILELLISPFFRLNILPEIIYIIYFAVCMFMISDKKYDYSKKKEKKSDAKAPAKKKGKEKSHSDDDYDIFKRF
ncbi:MAG: DUF1189 domain-containing protein [Nanoarchaeota archaeon]|nr:DUF1189 domain-containing protein [Nanoarchaeota archaeon]